MEMIASQHGKIIQKDLIDFFMSKLESLPVGLDLKGESRLVRENYIKAFNDILDTVERDVDSGTVKNLLKSFQSDGTFPNSLITKNNRIYSLKVGVDEAFTLFSNELCRNLDNEQKKLVRTIVVNSLADWNITTEIPCPGYVDPAQQASTNQDFLDSGQAKKAPEGKSPDLGIRELDNILDGLMGE